MTWHRSRAHLALQALELRSGRNHGLEAFIGEFGWSVPSDVVNLRLTEPEIENWRASLRTERAQMKHRLALVPLNQLVRMLLAVFFTLLLYWPYRADSFLAVCGLIAIGAALQIMLRRHHASAGERARDAQVLAELLEPADTSLIAEAKALALQPSAPARYLHMHQSIEAQGRSPVLLEIAALRALE